MATIEQLSAALVKADAAGNTADAKVFADAIRKMRSEAAPVASEPTFLQSVGQNVGNVVAGLGRGAGSIGATLATPIDMALGNTSSWGNPERRQRMDDAFGYLGAETDSLGYKGGKLVGEIAGTAGAGGALANVAGRVAPTFIANSPRALQAIEALKTGGFSLGSPAATTAAGKAADLGIRAAGGAISGGAQAAMIDPKDAGVGAAIGGVLPVAVQGVGNVARAVGNKVMPAKPVNMLRESLGLPEDVFAKLMADAKAGSGSIVDGSNLTLSQALEKQGANLAQIKILEKLVAQGPGGSKLANQYAAQDVARLEALAKQGAETYAGAPIMEKTAQGDKIGAILRTQAADDKAAARALWERTHGIASRDGVSLQLPLDDMQNAMSPLGRGSVVSGADARRVLDTANEIGTLKLPGIDELPKGAVSKSQSLEQAVRAAGGIKSTAGEVRDLGIRQSGTTGLVNNKSGKSLDLLAEEMHRRGFIPDSDPDTLVQAIRNNGGRKTFATDQVDDGFQRMAESAMGDLPGAQVIPQPIPFEEFQRLRRDSGSLAAKASERAGSETEAGVLARFQELLTKRADDAANGMRMDGDTMSPEFLDLYNQARSLTKGNAEKYKGGNNISQILRKPTGQDYTLNGDEIANKLWHGGSGLSGDVSNLKNTLSGNNYEPTMNALRKFIMTDAAGQTKASGDLGAALPKYFEKRLPGLQEALTPDQFKALQNVAFDIRNADAASSLSGAAGKGSDTYAKMAGALDAGVLDGPVAKSVARVLSFKGVGGDSAREWLANAVKESKGKSLAELLSNPAGLEAALQKGSPMRNALLEMLSQNRSAFGRDVGSIGQNAARLAIPATVD